MNRTFTPCLSCRSLSACRTCLVKSSETALVSLSYRRGATRFLTRVRGVWPSLNRILQSSSTRQTLMRLMPSATFGSSDHSRNVWSPDSCRSTALPGLAILNGLAANLDWPAAVLDWPAAVLDWPPAAEVVIIRNKTSNDRWGRWRCLFMSFTCFPVGARRAVSAGHHGARKLQVRW